MDEDDENITVEDQEEPFHLGKEYVEEDMV